MTKIDFMIKALKLGYSCYWINNAINTLSKLNKKYGKNYSYEDIMLYDINFIKSDNVSKFNWNCSDVIVFKPKK